jgi:hypothetical protein
LGEVDSEVAWLELGVVGGEGEAVGEVLVELFVVDEGVVVVEDDFGVGGGLEGGVFLGVEGGV